MDIDLSAYYKKPEPLELTIEGVTFQSPIDMYFSVFTYSQVCNINYTVLSKLGLDFSESGTFKRYLKQNNIDTLCLVFVEEFMEIEELDVVASQKYFNMVVSEALATELPVFVVYKSKVYDMLNLMDILKEFDFVKINENLDVLTKI